MTPNNLLPGLKRCGFFTPLVLGALVFLAVEAIFTLGAFFPIGFFGAFFGSALFGSFLADLPALPPRPLAREVPVEVL